MREDGKHFYQLNWLLECNRRLHASPYITLTTSNRCYMRTSVFVPDFLTESEALPGYLPDCSAPWCSPGKLGLRSNPIGHAHIFRVQFEKSAAWQRLRVSIKHGVP